MVSGAGVTKIRNTTISKNTAIRDGGGLYNTASLDIRNSRVLGNETTIASEGGGGIFNGLGGDATIIKTTISENSVKGRLSSGGGIYNSFDGTVYIVDSTVNDNVSTNSSGGGIYNNFGTLTVNRTTVFDNVAQSVGGGIYNGRGSTEIFNSTISGNSAQGNNVSSSGGGIYNGSGELSIRNSTIWGNVAPVGGAVYASSSGTATAQNSIMANSRLGEDCSNFVSADATNLDSDGSCDNAKKKSVAAIGLAPLADNGGPTWTHALLPGSAAIDAASTDATITTDQRAIDRPQGAAPDIGAFEAETGTIKVIKNTIPNDGQDFSFTLTGGLTPIQFELDDDGNDVLPNSQTFSGLPAGSYTVSETPFEGYTTEVSCIDASGGTETSDASAFISLAASETVTCTFTNTQQTPQIAVSDVAIEEGDNGVTKLVFEVTRTNNYFATSVLASTVAGTASADSDYDAIVDKVINFPAGGTLKKVVVVKIRGDGLVERDETLELTIEQAVNGTITKNKAVGTILNDDDAIVSLSGPVEHPEGDSGTTEYQFEATLNADVDGGFEIAYAIEDGTATVADGDYNAQVGTLQFDGTKGETKLITVVTNGDLIGEAHEVFYVTLGAVQTETPGIVIEKANNPQIGTITDDDEAVLFLDVNLGNNSAFESEPHLPVKVVLSNPVDRPTSVDFKLTEITATVGEDFVWQSGRIDIAAGSTDYVINVRLLDDDITEGVESFEISLSNPIGIALSDITSAELFIEDDEFLPAVTAADTTISEADATGKVDFTLSHLSSKPVSVRVMSANGTAKAGFDYSAVDQVVTFAPGETTQSVMIDLLADDAYERDETLRLMLSEIDNGQLPDQSTVNVTIAEDDAAPLVSVSEVTVAEPISGARAMRFQFELSHPAAVDISLDFETQDGTAESGKDYAFAQGTLVIKAGSTQGAIEVVILSDQEDEETETLALSLSNLSDGKLDGAAAAGSVNGEITVPTTGPPAGFGKIFLPVIAR